MSDEKTEKETDSFDWKIALGAAAATVIAYPLIIEPSLEALDFLILGCPDCIGRKKIFGIIPRLRPK